jgi:hypothetical protein
VDGPIDCKMTLWIDEDDQGVEYCLVDCDWFSRNVNILQWDSPPPTDSFVLPAKGSRPDTTCNLKGE